MEQPNLSEEQSTNFQRYYMNRVQAIANMLDPNSLFCEWGRGTGKTNSVTSTRIIRVANDLPGELGFLVHSTYVALLTNVWPSILAEFSRKVTVNGVERALMEYGIDFIAGEKKIPSHFRRPRYPVVDPKHCVLFRNGFQIQLVSSDQPDSVAGRSASHAFIEEMKHNKGDKLKSRLFPTLRGGTAETRKSIYYQGITAVSDTARVDLGEDDWFEAYEKNANKELEDEIMTVAMHLNAALVLEYKYQDLLRNTKDVLALEKVRLELERQQRIIATWQPRLADMRRNATVYLRASSFANKDILGPKFFKTQLETLGIDDFLTSICAIRQKAVVNKFFANYDRKKHQFADGYKYASIMKNSLQDMFVLTARYLKYYNPDDEILLGYDPGHFSSIVAAQEKNYGRETRVIKNFYACYPDEQPELAKQVYEFFGDTVRNKRIVLYPDRAGNKSREELEQVRTDSRLLKRELENYGFSVELMNEGQATVYHWQQYRLLLLIFGGRSSLLPQVLIDENECKELCNAIPLSPVKRIDGKIEMDKTSEKKVPLHQQASRTTQIPSALIYLLWGRYGEKVMGELSNMPDDLPDNMII
jgi:hypothetical protein